MLGNGTPYGFRQLPVIHVEAPGVVPVGERGTTKAGQNSSTPFLSRHGSDVTERESERFRIHGSRKCLLSRTAQLRYKNLNGIAIQKDPRCVRERLPNQRKIVD